MSRDYASWTKRQLAVDQTKTQAGLARHLGINKSAVSRMLSGDRKITASELDMIVAYLGVAHPRLQPVSGFSDPGTEYRAADTDPPVHRPQAPIYGITARTDGHWSLDRREPIDWRPKVFGHETSVRLFGFYAPDDSMAPRFKRGEIVWVEPSRPASAGQDALLMRSNEYEQLEHVILCEIHHLSHDRISFRQHNSAELISVSARDWTVHHVLDRT